MKHYFLVLLVFGLFAAQKSEQNIVPLEAAFQGKKRPFDHYLIFRLLVSMTKKANSSVTDFDLSLKLKRAGFE